MIKTGNFFLICSLLFVGHINANPVEAHEWQLINISINTRLRSVQNYYKRIDQEMPSCDSLFSNAFSAMWVWKCKWVSVAVYNRIQERVKTIEREAGMNEIVNIRLPIQKVSESDLLDPFLELLLG